MRSGTRTARAADEPELPAQVLRRFRVVFNAIKVHFREVRKDTGVAGAQLWALGVVAQNPDIGMTGLARAMDIHQSTASNLVRSLANRELLLVRREGEDKRTVALRLSAKGRRLLRSAPGPFTGVLPDAVASLDRATLARLDKDLQKLIVALHGDKRAEKIPIGQR